jgi:hypothetical protein
MPRKPQRVRLFWRNDIGQSATLTLDATLEEKHRQIVEVTSHPIEIGPNVSDFMRPEPFQLELQGVISNTPIVLPPVSEVDGARVVAVDIEGPPKTVGQVLGRPLPGVSFIANRPVTSMPRQTASVIGFDPEFDRVGTVYELLKGLSSNGTLITVILPITTWENMVLRSWEVTRNVRVGDSLELALGLQQVRIAKVNTVDVPAIPTAKVKKGNKPTKPAAAATPPEQESMLHSIFGN